MIDLLKFTCTLLVIVALILFGCARFFSIGGISPNVILVFFLGLIFIPAFRERIRLDYFFVLSVFSFLVGSFIFGFWITEWFLVSALPVLAFLLRNFLTGHPLPDFLLAIVISTVVFYALVGILIGGSFEWDPVLGETFYNFVLGIILWLPVNFAKKIWQNHV